MDATAGRICAEDITGKHVFIKFYRVKGGITEEGFGINQEMCTEIVLKRGNQEPCVMDRLIFIR